jgi:8-oxo-dGTP pyrophosphatase MutT (NUDIX family)
VATAPALTLADPVRHFPGLPVRSGALPYRLRDGRIEFLLIRRRSASHWSIPKGHLIDGVGYAGTARIEAIEEAGIEGTLGTEPVGWFRHRKTRQGFFTSDEIVEVVVYPLRVEMIDRRWQEDGVRERRWFAADAASAAVPDTLAAVLRDFALANA